MTPAEELREAARLMRERARAATPGPWNGDDGPWWWDDNYLSTMVTSHPDRTAVAVMPPSWARPGGDHEPDARHIASWHPGVALAVADWMETTERDVGTSSLAYHAALAVARAYLGTESS